MPPSKSRSKRHRLSAEDTKPEVVESSPIVVQPSEEPASEQFIVAPKLDEIPQLLFVELQKGKPEDVVEALNRIHDLYYLGDKDDINDPGMKNWENTRRLGPIGIVVMIMRRWSPNHDIQNMSCSALCNLLYDRSTAKMALVQCGGVEAVTSAMKNFPQSEDLQTNACNTLRNTFINLTTNPKVVKDCACCFVEELEGVDLLVKTMKEFPDNTSILEDCCMVFNNLAACFKQHQDIFIDAGVVEAVAAVQKKHSNNKDLKEGTKQFMSVMFS
ncbi:ARM [Seminavis robusta]|uniref:ARM n=1 Tax=Seminavis robusta TaxID=568900 RepID=A0A9N8DS30_9STRA|nr:ARM [Seminavis robusta]|eukprot:Sro312_g114510.1 ARM (272) ;mRNA; r:16077-16892